MNFILALATLIGATSAQFLIQQPIPYTLQHHQPIVAAPQPPQSLAHPAVIENAINESHLPAELIRSKSFLRNPKTADALAKDSWLTDKEMPVFDREAEKIPRDQVYKIFKNAGFLHSRRR